MSDLDSELLKQADELVQGQRQLENKRLDLQRREMALRHERRGRWIRAFLIVGCVAAISIGVAGPALKILQGWEARAAAENRERLIRQQQAISERDSAWEKCIQTQGVAACTRIEERSLLSCFYKRNQERTYNCMEKRLTDMGLP